MTTTRVRQHAKRLKRHLAEDGYDLRLTHCQRMMAAMLGYRDWPQMCRSLDTEPPSPGDCEVDEQERREGRDSHVEVLVSFGIAGNHAAPAVDAIRPTGYAPLAVDAPDDADDFEQEWGLRPSGRRKESRRIDGAPERMRRLTARGRSLAEMPADRRPATSVATCMIRTGARENRVDVRGSCRIRGSAGIGGTLVSLRLR